MPYKIINGVRVSNGLTRKERAAVIKEMEKDDDLGPAILPRFIKNPPADLVTTRRTEAQEPQSPEAPSPHDAQRTREGR
ncbi:MAG: hypothetical protein AB7F36_08305 [Reyranellaceae bacterium]